jgi:hypothetical protein
VRGTGIRERPFHYGDSIFASKGSSSDFVNRVRRQNLMVKADRAFEFLVAGAVRAAVRLRIKLKRDQFLIQIAFEPGNIMSYFDKEFIQRGHVHWELVPLPGVGRHRWKG